MKDKQQQLMNQVSGLPDKELLHILDEASSDYRFETIIYAKAEADKRGLSYSQPDIAPSSLLSTRTLTSILFGILRSHIFGIGVLVTLALFVLANYVNYTHVSTIACDDCILGHGFPFTHYETGGFAGAYGIYYSWLALNIAIALVLGIAVGWLCRKMFGIKRQST